MNLRTKIIQNLVHINEGIFFYPKLRKFYKQNLNSKTIKIIDVGANKGQSIDFFLNIYPDAEIDSFEPNKKLFSFLQTRYSKAPNVKPHNFGISNTKGELVFHENILDETSTFEELNMDSKYLAKKSRVLGVAKEDIIVDNYKVDVITLTDFLKGNMKMKYDVLKIDVEGHELQCLQGLFNDELKIIPIRYIQLENHNNDMYLSSQHNKTEVILNKNGFFKVAEIKHGFGDFTEIIYENKKTE